MVTYIRVPDMNDSYSRVVLDNREYLVRFLYNGEHDFWTFGIYDTGRKQLLQQRKILPLLPLTHFDRSVALPDGIFGCLTQKAHVGRDDFRAKNAEFVFIPWADLDEWSEKNGIIR